MVSNDKSAENLVSLELSESEDVISNLLSLELRSSLRNALLASAFAAVLIVSSSSNSSLYSALLYAA